MSDAAVVNNSVGANRAPTRVRLWIVGFATVMAVLLYLDRYCLSFSERYIKEELGLTNAQSALLLSVFFYSYGLGQVPSGWLSDRYGSRLMLGLYILVWSIMTGLMGGATTLLLLLTFRVGCGLAQAGAYPTGALMVSKWMPFGQRGLASGIISMGGRVGGVLAPLLTAYLMIAFIPSGKSMRVEPGDVLDARVFCKDLVLPHPKQPWIDKFAAKLRGKLSEKANGVLLEGAAPDGASSVADLQPVLQELGSLQDNEALDDLVDNSDLFNLPARPPEAFTRAEQEGRNRLLLENAFPDAIRKRQGLGWRPTFIVYGAIGVIIALLFWLLVRDSPRQHPLCNTAEITLIEGARVSPASSSRAGKLPLGHILRSRSLWFSSLSQFTTNFGWAFIVLLFARYLADVHQVPVIQRSWMTSIPIMLGIAGMLFGGWLTDWLTRRMGLFWGRCLPMSLTRFLAMGAFIVCYFLQSPWEVTLALAAAAVATDLGTPAIWAFNQDIGGRYVGSALGWGNMWGNVGAALSPVALNWIIETKGWNVMFLACAAAFLISGITAFGVDARIPLIPEEAEGQN